MRILLHIGMPKSGSSALQYALTAARERLLYNGVFYPPGGSVRVRHDLLIAGLLRRMPRTLAHRYGGAADRLDHDCETWLRQLNRQVKTTRPDVLILSSESLFRVCEERALTELARRLRQLRNTIGSDDMIEVIAYVRRPSDHFLSMAQQILRASHTLRESHDGRLLGEVTYRATLEGFATHVAERVHVVKYDRGAWPGSDIVRHFLETFVPEAASDIASPPHEVNTSLSAEAMSLLADYRRAFYAEENHRFTPDTTRLIRALTDADADAPDGRRPRLHEDVRYAIDQGSTDLLWLRDRHGVVFDGIDYDRIRPVAFESQPERVEDICPINEERKALLTLEVLYRLSQSPVGTPAVSRPTVRRLLAMGRSLGERFFRWR